MKHLFTNRSLPLVVSVTLATVTLPALLAESHCPAGIASVTPRFVQRALIVIPVRINQKGPFDFMVDTGSQITVVDPSLAVELGLKPQGEVGLVVLLPSPATCARR
jgi:Aspartyl protease